MIRYLLFITLLGSFSSAFCLKPITGSNVNKVLNFYSTLPIEYPKATIKDESIKPFKESLKLLPPDHWNERDHTIGFHLGGFLLGLFIPIAGIFIASKIGGKAKKNRMKWAIIGSGITIGLLLIILLSHSTKY